MKSRNFLVTLATFLAVSVSASAQEAPRWRLGVAAAVPDSVQADDGTRVTPLPLVAYREWQPADAAHDLTTL